MKKLKVVTVVGTRPEIIRLSRVITCLENSKAIQHFTIHTGQNYDYELNEIFFKDLGLNKPDYFLDSAVGNPSGTIGNIISKIDPILNEISPDAFLILGDTNSCLASIVAKKKKIPICHMEAGNRCFDQRVPEETNRKIVDHISDINLTYSDIAREYLLNEGYPSDQIIRTGSPMFEVLNYYKDEIYGSDILNMLKINAKEYFLVSCHREENVNNDDNLSKLITSLNLLSKKYKFPIIFSTHPRTKKAIESQNFSIDKNIIFLKPLGFFDYNFLQINSFVTLSDSGTISEESSILNFPAINIREAHERPEAMEEASVIMTGLDPERIIQSVTVVSNQLYNSDSREFFLVKDYSYENVSKKVERIIISYVNYINKKVWKKTS